MQWLSNNTDKQWHEKRKEPVEMQCQSFLRANEEILYQMLYIRGQKRASHSAAGFQFLIKVIAGLLST